MGELVFVDSSFWIALRDTRQPQHPRAASAVQGLFHERAVFVLTFLVLAEIHAYFSRSEMMRQRVLLDLWNNPVVRIEPVSFQDQEEAIHLVGTHRDKEYSLCDAVSFVLMRRLGIRRVLSFDDHFRQIGEFEVVC